MAIEYFVFGGQDSRDCGVYISGSGVFGAPERDGSKVSIPGRNGEMFLDNGRYKNIDIKYPAFIKDDFSDNIKDFRNKIAAQKGYQRLEDSYHTDEFRIARYKGAVKTKPVLRGLNKQTFDITFDAKPQRFLKSGETPTEYTVNGTITNPTEMTALPLVRVIGTGTLTIGSVAVTITNNTAYIDIDCETQEAYYGSVNMNSCIQLTNGLFPSLAAGSNAVDIGTLTKVTITPRWWIL